MPVVDRDRDLDATSGGRVLDGIPDEAGINVTAAAATAAGSGRYGMIPGSRRPITSGQPTSSVRRVPALFQQHLEPALRGAGVTVLATYTTEHSENTFPALPIRENENVFIWMSLFEDEADHGRHVRDLERSSVWRGASRVLAGYLAGSEEILRLCPTARSAIHA